jgi:hypothetical protein
MNICSPQEHLWKPPLPQAAGTLCVSKLVVRVLNIFGRLLFSIVGKMSCILFGDFFPASVEN